jgi:hypothetical protein
VTTGADISLKCVCKRSLTSDGKCPTCSRKPDNCVCDEDIGFPDNAAELQALAGGGGEMGSSPPGLRENNDDQALPSDQR